MSNITKFYFCRYVGRQPNIRLNIHGCLQYHKIPKLPVGIYQIFLISILASSLDHLISNFARTSLATC